MAVMPVGLDRRSLACAEQTERDGDATHGGEKKETRIMGTYSVRGNDGVKNKRFSLLYTLAVNPF